MRRCFLFVAVMSLLACTTTPTLKAPCNASGSNCGAKIKINQWNN